jgi:hypothetical protein
MKHPLPPNGAPQYDTRENERPDMCCECDEDPDTCGYASEECEQAAVEDAAENNFEARRDEPDDEGILSGRNWT